MAMGHRICVLTPDKWCIYLVSERETPHLIAVTVDPNIVAIPETVYDLSEPHSLEKLYQLLETVCPAMKIIYTARELITLGVWDKVCEMRGINPYCVNEGLMDSSEEIVFTEPEAKSLGLIPQRLISED